MEVFSLAVVRLMGVAVFIAHPLDEAINNSGTVLEIALPDLF
jgi:hypothetical protein